MYLYILSVAVDTSLLLYSTVSSLCEQEERSGGWWRTFPTSANRPGGRIQIDTWLFNHSLILKLIIRFFYFLSSVCRHIFIFIYIAISSVIGDGHIYVLVILYSIFWYYIAYFVKFKLMKCRRIYLLFILKIYILKL